MRYWLYDAMGGGGWREVDEWKANQFRRSFAVNPGHYEGWQLVESIQEINPDNGFQRSDLDGPESKT